MATTQRDELQPLIRALKLSVATLREREIPFALGGSMAAWARGGPVTQNDLDLMVRPQDADAALAALAEAGLRPERPPEEWLYKAWLDDVLIDLIFRPAGLEIDDVLVTMLCAIDEHALDYSRLVAIARSLREQIDWAQLRARTGGSPYARAFFTLVEGLGIAPAPTTGHPPAPPRVRVLQQGR